MSRVRLRLEGQRYGRLVVVRFHDVNKHRSSTWECICDCGNSTIVESHSLRRKGERGHARSCGCLRADPDSNMNRVLNEYRQGARRRGLDWALSKGQALELFKGNCHYCGVVPGGFRNYQAGEPFSFNGIDRIDSSRGYIMGNCVPCCAFCNYRKNDTSYAEFIKWIDKAYHNIYGND